MAGDNSNSGSKQSGNPPWQARTLWIAAGLSLLGLVLWVTTPAMSSAGQGTLAEAPGEAVVSSVHTLQGSPALFRFGLSYIAGFFLGYGLRRFLKVTLVISMVVVASIFMMRKLGWVELDWSGIEGHLADSFGWIKGQAEALKVFVMGYVPSTIAAGVGVLFGARWR